MLVILKEGELSELSILIKKLKSVFKFGDTIDVQVEDTWSLDNTLAKVIVASLEKFKINVNGHPLYVMSYDIPDEYYFKVDTSGDVPEDMCNCTMETWYWIIDEIIWSFNQVLDEEWIYTMTPDEYVKHSARIRKGHKMFGTYFNHFWT